MLDISLALAEILDEGEDASPLCPPVFTRKVVKAVPFILTLIFCETIVTIILIILRLFQSDPDFRMTPIPGATRLT